MFERFTERARQVVVNAQDEARALGHGHIGTEHILLGLLRLEGPAAAALATAGVSLEGMRGAVKRSVGRGETNPVGQMPFTPRGKKVLELSLREALSLGDNHIDDTHVLLGLLREETAVAYELLVEAGVDVEAVRDRAVQGRTDLPPRRPRTLRRLFRVVELGEVTETALQPHGDEGWDLVTITGSGPYRAVFQRQERTDG